MRKTIYVYSAKGFILDQSLVDAHLIGIPGLATLTVGGLSGGDFEGFGLGGLLASNI